LKSENTSAYVQGRNRLPLSVLVGALRHTYKVISSELSDDNRYWKGHSVRFMDGTTVRLRPFGDLEETYGKAENQHGKSYWVVVRVLATFCLQSEALVAAKEASLTTSETAIVREVFEQEEENSIYVSDQGLSVYRTVQTAEAMNHKVVMRVEKRTANRLWKSTIKKAPLVTAKEHDVIWKPAEKTKVDPNLPIKPIRGRLIYFRIEKKGFRPIDVYLFTTLLSSTEYPMDDIFELYGMRWQVEIDLRQIKTTLEMEQFEVKSAQMFRKELIAGLLTYNIIRALMLKTAIKKDIEVRKLSFQKCLRRIRKILFHFLPSWAFEKGNAIDYLLDQLAKCTLPNQPNKVKYEPRKVRRKPAVYPQLRGSREEARKEVLQALAA
jgi:IS4 transposase